MARLLWKELRSAWWITALACATAFVLVLSGDPLSFRGDSMTSLSSWLILPVLLLGLRSYSSELGGDTVQFLGSRPIMWWKVWIAKVLAGVIQIILLFLVAAGSYALFVPEQYRPFLWQDSTAVMSDFLLALAFVFWIGFGASMMVPGIPLSAAALVLAVIILFSPFILVSMIPTTWHLGWLQDLMDDAAANTVLLSLVAMLPATLLTARRLPKLSPKGRWVTVMAFPFGAMVLSWIIAGVYGNITPGSHSLGTDYRALSLDGRMAVCGVNWGAHQYLMDTSTGRRLAMLPGGGTDPSAWSPDSSALAYCPGKYTLNILAFGAHPGVGTTATMHLRSHGRNKPASLRHADLIWSPSGDCLVVVWIDWQPDAGRTRYSMLVLNRQAKVIATVRSAKPIEMKATASYAGSIPVLVGTRLIFWPSKDGGRFTSIGSNPGCPPGG